MTPRRLHRPYRPLLAALAIVVAGSLAVPAEALAAKRSRPAAKASKKKEPPPEAPVAEADAEQIKAAQLVYYGKYDCEFKQSLDIAPSPKHTAYAEVKSGKSSWLMKPVLSATGAVRLEDVKGEALMVQIASKSMVLNVKTAQRVVDDCVSEQQRELIQAAKVSPAVDSALLTAPGAVAASASAPAADAAPASASAAASAAR